MEIITREIHRPITKPKKYRKVVSYHINNIWALDLVEMQEFKDNNNGYNYILTCIDLYSRYAWVKPLKNKTALEVKNAIESIIKEVKAYPQKFYVDEGKEFYNKTLDNLRSKLHIDIYSTYGNAKSSVIERFNRTFKSLMYKKFTLNQNRVWYDILDELLDVYNNKCS
jgi:IS30 family transposase